MSHVHHVFTLEAPTVEEAYSKVQTMFGKRGVRALDLVEVRPEVLARADALRDDQTLDWEAANHLLSALVDPTRGAAAVAAFLLEHGHPDLIVNGPLLAFRAQRPGQWVLFGLTDAVASRPAKRPRLRASAPRRPRDFDTWHCRVASIIETYGVSIDDLPDADFTEGFDEGVAPRAFARSLLEDAGFRA